MGLKSTIKEFFNPSNWSDETLIRKSLPDYNYIGVNGIHNYSRQPGFTIIDPANYRSLMPGATSVTASSHNYIQLFHAYPEIFAPIHAIASRIANADFQLRKYRNDEVVYDNAEWNRLFNSPNPLQNFRELIYEAVVYEYVTGNAFLYFNTPSTLTKDFKNVASIWNLPAGEVEIVHDKKLKLFTATAIEDLIKEYKLDDQNRYAPQDILHLRATNLEWSDRKLFGKSPLMSAAKAIDNLISVYSARLTIYDKRGALGFIVSRKSDAGGMVSLTPHEKQAIRDQYQGDYGVTRGKSPIGITEAPVDFVKIGASIAEMQPFEETLLDAMAIYAALQVPRELIPMKDGATYENQKAADRGFYQNVIIPKAMSYVQSLTNKLRLADSRLYLHASFDHIEVLQENQKERAEVNRAKTDTAVIRFMHGVITLNDFVVEAGYEKVNNGLYDKRIFEMSPEELQNVKSVLSLKAPARPAQPSSEEVPNNQNSNSNEQQ